MRQPLYIQAAVAISPQNSFEREHFLQPLITSDHGKLYIKEPDYKPYINPVAIRRMSRVMKMAISCAIQCLKEAGVEVPDAIITGTGRGSMSDMEHFLNDLIRLNEGAMNPTHFIQSTYNSPNGWIALQMKSTAYNQTYVHRGSSLELALLDAQLLLEEAGDDPQHLLVGCYDELTDDYFTVKEKIGYWKHPKPSSADLLQLHHSAGTIGGEGSAFFTFSNVPGNAKSVVRNLVLLQHADGGQIHEVAATMLRHAHLETVDIDLVLIGTNGDHEQQNYYTDVLSIMPDDCPVAGFKHLCGEFDTASGFALWLCDQLIREQNIPDVLFIKKGTPKPLRHILLINHYILGSASVLLIQKSDSALF